MPDGTLSDDHSGVTFGWIGKAIVGVVIAGIPALIGIGIWIAVHLAVLANQQASTLATIQEMQMADKDNQAAIKALDIRVWHAQISADNAAREAERGREEIVGKLGEVKATVKEKIPTPEPK